MLISPTELDSLPQRTTRVFDASWYLPSDNRDPDAEFLAAHIRGAQRFDFDAAFAESKTDLPHMLPDAGVFQSGLRRLGVNQDDTLVVYDTAGLFSSARAWWMLRTVGFEDVRVLNGGLPAWRSAGRAVETGPARPPVPGNGVVRLRSSWLASAENVVAAIECDRTVIVDARPEARFTGQQPEPRPGLRCGHIPGSVNLPFGLVLDDGKLRSVTDLKAYFDAIAPQYYRLIFTCGSGVTAAILALAAVVAGREQVSVYDGSWAEWGRDATKPVAAESRVESQ
ncbi:MAG: sulfurtransferase [Pseudomonadota bacterium]